MTNETEIVLIKRDRKGNFDKSPKLGGNQNNRAKDFNLRDKYFRNIGERKTEFKDLMSNTMRVK